MPFISVLGDDLKRQVGGWGGDFRQGFEIGIKLEMKKFRGKRNYGNHLFRTYKTLMVSGERDPFGLRYIQNVADFNSAFVPAKVMVVWKIP